MDIIDNGSIDIPFHLMLGLGSGNWISRRTGLPRSLDGYSQMERKIKWRNGAADLTPITCILVLCLPSSCAVFLSVLLGQGCLLCPSAVVLEIRKIRDNTA